MNLLLNLLDWVSLEKAAARLGTIFHDNLTAEDLFQLAMSNELAISWLTESVYAERVTPYSSIHYPYPKKKASQTVTSRLEEAIASLEPPMPQNKAYSTQPMLERFSEDNELPIHLNGAWVIDPDLNGGYREWLQSLAAGIEEYDCILLDGLILQIPDQGGFFRALNEQKTPTKLYHRTKPMDYEYYPMETYPPKSELVIKTNDLLEFETKLLGKRPQCTNSSQREMNSQLRIIAALLDITIDNTRADNSADNRNCDIKSQAQLIELMTDQYQGYEGLSKRNLEAVFAKAKRLLTMN